jgi:hypothetical protein
LLRLSSPFHPANPWWSWFVNFGNITGGQKLGFCETPLRHQPARFRALSFNVTLILWIRSTPFVWNLIIQRGKFSAVADSALIQAKRERLLSLSKCAPLRISQFCSISHIWGRAYGLYPASFISSRTHYPLSFPNALSGISLRAH